ncbi:hypothetical protein GCM10010172_16240 [Paractinoplanes ferrugineus]|uniref:Uncharacterized protein n=1 Tax=Paractinoplanes ferrugineus TaxID=113564 RepID=A0A919MBY2_9ACTN|nr:hypothetical protein [Actinoplanes ferrugineus]GIE10188.1 hypothetical protein Afe05nite_20280 [Actinoplanes ferrugineus]
MNNANRRPADDTGESAIGDLAGDALLTELRRRIADETDRNIILGSIGLEMSDRNLALALNVDKAHVRARLVGLIAVLREDETISAKLQDLRRAGRVENFLALASRLGLQHWFCAACGSFMVQSEQGRPRRTCGTKCRVRLSRANSRPGTRPSSDTHPGPPTAPAPVSDELLHRLEQTLGQDSSEYRSRAGGRRRYAADNPAERLRDRAAVLLGLTCHIALTPTDIAALDIDDVMSKARNLELRLYRRLARPTQYVTVPSRANQAICPVAAVLGWKRHLASAGHRTGPLFVRVDLAGNLTHPVRRMAGYELADRIVGTAHRVLADPEVNHSRSSLVPVRSLIH